MALDRATPRPPAGPPVPAVVALGPLGEEARADLAARAAAELASGRVVVLPTDTVYGLFISAAIPAAVEGLGALLRSAGTDPLPHHWAWHAPTRDAAIDLVRPGFPLHRRLMRRLMPGPVKFRVARPAPELDAMRARLRAAPGTLHDGSVLGLRVADHAFTNRVLALALEAGHPAVATGPAAAKLGDGRTVSAELRRAIEGASPHAPSLAVDDGQTRFGAVSTTIRLDPNGSYAVIGEGALEERHIRRIATRTILFVCTGNTCRSPMAEAIARHELGLAGGEGAASPAPGGVTTVVRSAGTSAGSGDPISPEALVALGELGIDPAEASRHRSRPLTRPLLDEAEVVFAMTASHARAARAADPAAAGKIHVLDPEGRDVPDPIGGPQEVYTATADRLQELIRRRLAELPD